MIVEEVGGKPAELTFKFFGGGCAADNNSHGVLSHLCHPFGPEGKRRQQMMQKKRMSDIHKKKRTFQLI